MSVWTTCDITATTVVEHHVSIIALIKQAAMKLHCDEVTVTEHSVNTKGSLRYHKCDASFCADSEWAIDILKEIQHVLDEQCQHFLITVTRLEIS